MQPKIAVIYIVLSISMPVTARAQSVLDKIVAAKIKAELSKRDSPDAGLRNGPNWVCLDNPEKHLTVAVNVKLADGKASISGTATGKLKFNYQVEIEKTILGKRIVIAREDFGGYADATLTLNASAAVGEHLSDAKVSIEVITIKNLKMRSDAAKPFQGKIQDTVNSILNAKKAEIAHAMETAINSSL